MGTASAHRHINQKRHQTTQALPPRHLFLSSIVATRIAYHRRQNESRTHPRTSSRDGGWGRWRKRRLGEGGRGSLWSLGEGGRVHFHCRDRAKRILQLEVKIQFTSKPLVHSKQLNMKLTHAVHPAVKAPWCSCKHTLSENMLRQSQGHH